MYDLHCHILPGIDDGPSNLDDSIVLLKAMIEDGVTHTIATPHIHQGRWDNDVSSINRVFTALCDEVKKQRLPIELAVAAEVRLDSELIDKIKSAEIPFLGWYENRQVLLLEMPHGQILPGTEKVTRWLMDHDIVPMLAHPERNKEVMAAPEKLIKFIESGCLIQVTAGSLVGQFGGRAQKVARDLLRCGLITLLASDAHNTRQRKPNLSAGFKYAKLTIGESNALTLVKHTPAEIFHSNVVFSAEGNGAACTC